LNGIGRKIYVGSYYEYGYVEEGHFVNNKLNGFGRLMRNSGYLAVGYWSDFWVLNGYAK